MPSSGNPGGEPFGEPGHRLPPPPRDFGSRPLPITLSEGPWYRLHRAEFDPVYFGKRARNRFDDPHRLYGVLYASQDEHGAFVEVFGRDLERRLLSEAEVGAYLLSRIEAPEGLRLADLTGGGLQRAGVTNAITTYPHEEVRPWSRAIHEHPEGPDGILYHLKHDPRRIGLAVFERAVEERSLLVAPLGGLLDPANVPTLDDIFEEYGKDLI